MGFSAVGGSCKSLSNSLGVELPGFSNMVGDVNTQLQNVNTQL